MAGANSLYTLYATPYSTLYLPSLRKQTKGVGVTQLESLSSVYDRELALSLSYYITIHNPPR